MSISASATTVSLCVATSSIQLPVASPTTSAVNSGSYRRTSARAGLAPAGLETQCSAPFLGLLPAAVSAFSLPERGSALVSRSYVACQKCPKKYQRR